MATLPRQTKNSLQFWKKLRALHTRRLAEARIPWDKTYHQRIIDYANKHIAEIKAL